MVCLTCGKEFDRDVVKNPESSIKKSYMPIDQGLQQQILGLQQQIQQAYKEGNQQRAMQLNQQLAKLLENPNAPVQNMIGLASKDCTCEGDCQCGDDCSCGKEAMVKEAPGKEHMKGVSPKRNRQYEDILASCRKSHPDWTEDRCKELAARTVNKTRSEKGETKSSIDKEGFDPSPLIPLSPLLGIIGSLAARIIATEVRLHKERKVDKQQLEDRIREYLTSQGHAPEEVEQAIQQADQQGIIDPSGLTMDIPRNIQRRYLNGSIEPIDTIDKFFVDSPEFADNIYEGARSDYDHWNEDADRMWWEEEGKHPHEPEYDPDDYLHGGGGAEEAAIDELYEDFRDMEDADLEEIIAGTYAGYLPYAEHLDPSTFKEIAQEVLAERRPQQPQFVYQSRSTQSWYDG
ncbi:MAG TPA: hypothetical protein VKE92_00495, partial [Anaerolineales bacterium]|nr:hypothetical protein [Anaerolineales bacterium]